ncbi:prepilin peptidase [Candidatus Margulisiibacteriota bacterium]
MHNLILLFILGAAVGSFLNVCIYRLPRGESIIRPPSHCPSCNHHLGIIDLIPILGYLIRRGKCKYCDAPFSWRYPLVELLTGLLFVIAWRLLPLPLASASGLVFVSLLIIIFFTDLEHQVIPDCVSYSGIVLGLIYNLFRGQIVNALLGAALGYSLLFGIGLLGKLALKKEAMGEGDLFLAAMLGAWLGWQGVLLSIFLAYLVAGVICLFLLLLRKVKIGEYVPFGPAVVAGGLITLFFGQQILNWYLGTLF